MAKLELGTRLDSGQPAIEELATRYYQRLQLANGVRALRRLSPEPTMKIGEWQLQMQRPDLAASTAKGVVGADGLVLRAKSELEQGRGDSAQQLAEQALAKEPNNLQAVQELGLALAVRQDAQALSNLIARQRSSETRQALLKVNAGELALAQSLFATSHYKRANEVLVNLRDQSAEQQLLLALIELRRERPDTKSAREKLLRGVSLDPGNTQLRRLLVAINSKEAQPQQTLLQKLLMPN